MSKWKEVTYRIKVIEWVNIVKFFLAFIFYLLFLIGNDTWLSLNISYIPEFWDNKE